MPPDPTLLPVATTSQSATNYTAAYNALNVPGMAAGTSYLDPATSVKVYKLTDATFPNDTPAHNWAHSYSEGGDEISLPHTVTTRTIHLYNPTGGFHWFIDFTPGVGVSNARILPSAMQPYVETSFAFSNNPATPYYCYIGNSNSLRRWDVRTMTEATGSGFPVTGETNVNWVHQAANDSFFTWMRGVRVWPIVGYDPSGPTLKTHTNTSYNPIQPRIDRGGRYIGVTLDAPNVNGGIFWDWLNNVETWITPGDGGVVGSSNLPFAHNACLSHQYIGGAWNDNFPFPFYQIKPDVVNTWIRFDSPSVGNDFYANGNWIQTPANPDDQWALASTYGALVPSFAAAWISPGGMVYVRRSSTTLYLLGFPFATDATYNYYSFVKQSSDGAYVLFTSNMNGSARNDQFLVEVPQSGATQNPARSVASGLRSWNRWAR